MSTTDQAPSSSATGQAVLGPEGPPGEKPGEEPDDRPGNRGRDITRFALQSHFRLPV